MHCFKQIFFFFNSSKSWHLSYTVYKTQSYLNAREWWGSQRRPFVLTIDSCPHPVPAVWLYSVRPGLVDLAGEAGLHPAHDKWNLWGESHGHRICCQALFSICRRHHGQTRTPFFLFVRVVSGQWQNVGHFSPWWMGHYAASAQVFEWSRGSFEICPLLKWSYLSSALAPPSLFPTKTDTTGARRDERTHIWVEETWWPNFLLAPDLWSAGPSVQGISIITISTNTRISPRPVQSLFKLTSCFCPTWFRCHVHIFCC